MRFRKRVKIFQGFYLNFSNSGISSTLGVKGASINVSRRGTYLNTGIPGAGIYHRQKIGGGNVPEAQSPENTFPDYTPITQPQVVIGEIKSAETESLTSTGLVELKDTLQEVYNDRTELRREINLIRNEIKSARTTRTITRLFLFGFFIKYFTARVVEKEEYLADLENQLKNSFVNIDVHFDSSYEDKYNTLLNCYKLLLTSEVIWDITSSFQQDVRITRSAASTVVTRTPVKFRFDNIEIIKSTYPAFHFENKNGGDLYIYPAFVIITSNKKEFALIDIKEFKVTFSPQRFLEREKIPSDSKIIDKTWAKVNKNGTPDRRFTGNYELPIVRYGQLDITSASGLNESYCFSNYDSSEAFVNAFTKYQLSL